MTEVSTAVPHDRQVCPSVDDLMAEANALLDRTPDPEFWSLADDEFVEFTFPDWQVLAYHARQTRQPPWLASCAIARHRTHADWWLFIGGGTHLLDYRGGTMGQFFRYNHHRCTMRAGTVDEVLTGLKRTHHPDAWGGWVTWAGETIASLLDAPTTDQSTTTGTGTGEDEQMLHVARTHVEGTRTLLALRNGTPEPA